eukprot:UN01023
MFSAPLEVNFYIELIREIFGQHSLTIISLRAPENVQNIWKMPPWRSVALLKPYFREYWRYECDSNRK